MVPSCGMLLQRPGEKRKLSASEQAFHAIDKATDTVLTDSASYIFAPGGRTGTKRSRAPVAATLRAA